MNVKEATKALHELAKLAEQAPWCGMRPLENGPGWAKVENVCTRCNASITIELVEGSDISDERANKSLTEFLGKHKDCKVVGGGP